MSDITKVNPQILTSIEAIQQATLVGSIIRHTGAGKAFQSVSQSSAMAIQDATDNLRNISTMSATAMGVAIAQMLATGDVATYTPIITQANTMITNSAENFKTIGNYAGALLKDFPVGD